MIRCVMADIETTAHTVPLLHNHPSEIGRRNNECCDHLHIPNLHIAPCSSQESLSLSVIDEHDENSRKSNAGGGNTTDSGYF